jgi:23S rRNA U2552 (ribose-2'-O)-methylase RlmE/FtsJ
MGGNHLRQMRNPRTILDLGSGNGAWTVEIAQEFATADEVVGVDIEATAPLQYPPNCRFEVFLWLHVIEGRLPMYVGA